MSEHIDYIFNTVQLPPTVMGHQSSTLLPIEQSKITALKRKSQTQTLTIAPQDVTISFLNNLYSITSNNGSNTLSQSVFQTNDQYFSPQDLTVFQQLNGVTLQAAELVGGYETSTCSLTGDNGNNCFEANLDTQYIMGISQNTSTIG